MCSIAARHNNILKAEEILHTSRSGGGLIYTLLHKLVNQQAVDTAGRQQASHNTHTSSTDLKANFCGHEKEGHFHYKNFSRASK